MGLVVSLLLDVMKCQSCYDKLIHLKLDQNTTFRTILETLIVEKWSRLSELTRRQLLWLLKQLLANQIGDYHLAYMNMMRNIISGDVSPRNLWLAETILDAFIEHRAVVEANNTLLSMSLYNYLRLLVEHHAFPALRHKEIGYCLRLLREHFNKFIEVGRDLVRLLQYVIPIHEFQRFWKDLLLNPTSIFPGTFLGNS